MGRSNLVVEMLHNEAVGTFEWYTFLEEEVDGVGAQAFRISVGGHGWLFVEFCARLA